MKILHVAEKPDAAKKISGILSNNQAQRRPGKSKYNSIYEFKYKNNDMVFTSVSGHLYDMDFEDNFRQWGSCDPVQLFEAPIVKFVPENSKLIAETLRIEAKKCQQLVLWLDCDREGENIAFEVIDCCQKANKYLTVKRAKFSDMTNRSIVNAMNNLVSPNKNDSLAVDARREIDLRIGASFTRFQTTKLKRKFEGLPEGVISYGSCQFPTLGFIVERYLKKENFVSENYWYIFCEYEKDKKKSIFQWKRKRLFDKQCCVVLYEMLLENPNAKVIRIEKKEKRKWRPYPMNTVELQKLAARKLNLSAHQTMEIAEKLYNQGFISYPRTETNIFHASSDELKKMIKEVTLLHPDFSEYSKTLLEDDKFVQPKQGKDDDKAHPPISPTKSVTNLNGKEKGVYELICRHFLACCSNDGIGYETIITIDIASEIFTTSGLMIKELNYLNIYVYDKWTDKSLPLFEENEVFLPTALLMKEEKTRAPPLLSEENLISTMDKNQIGTDATISQHIKNITDREYTIKQENVYVPTKLGLALIQGYDSMDISLSKPNLRAKMELDMKSISRGKDSKLILYENVEMYKAVFKELIQKYEKLDETMNKYFDQIGTSLTSSAIIKNYFSKCGKCQGTMQLKSSGDTNFAFCTSCKESHVLPKYGTLKPYNHQCPLCNYQVVSVLNESKNTTYYVCPYCTNNPPKQQNDIENLQGQFKCFNCNEKSCVLSTKEEVFAKCDACGNNLILKLLKSNKYTISCKNYKGCKSETLWLPDAKDISISNEYCDKHKNIKKLKFEFIQGKVPYLIPLKLTTCICCPSPLSEFQLMSIYKLPTSNVVIHNKSNTRSVISSNSNSSTRVLGKRNELEPRKFNDQKKKKNEIPICKHNKKAVLLTCKNGQNAGREFFKCALKDGQCDFFQWKE
eukprot:gene3222-5537_t